MISISPETNFSSAKRNELENLRSNIEKCENLQICVAYMTDWQFDWNLTSALVSKLSKPNSFLIVDPSNPTNHNYCDILKQQGCNIYFSEKKFQRSQKETNKLMHTKIYLFDFGSEVEIWIGSMNFTLEGVCGENLECSLKYRCHKSDPIYLDTLSYMEFIKSTFCSKWPDNKIGKRLIQFYKLNSPDFNKFLGDLEKCILFVTNDITKLNLVPGSFVNIFFLSDNVADLKKGSSYTLIVLDSKKQTYYKTPCKITQIADIVFGKSNLEISNPKPFAIHPLHWDYLYLFEAKLFDLVRSSNNVKSIVTLEINNELSPLLNIYEPYEKIDFYTTFIKSDYEEKRFTNFRDIIEIKKAEKIKRKISNQMESHEYPETILKNFLFDVENYFNNLLEIKPNRTFHDVDLTKKIKVLNNFLIDHDENTEINEI